MVAAARDSVAPLTFEYKQNGGHIILSSLIFEQTTVNVKSRLGMLTGICGIISIKLQKACKYCCLRLF